MNLLPPTSYIALASTLKSLGLVDGNIHVLASYEHRETLKDASLSHIPIIGDNVEEQLKSSKNINDAIAKNDYERLVELTRNMCRNVAKSQCHSIMNFLEHQSTIVFDRWDCKWLLWFLCPQETTNSKRPSSPESNG